MIDRKTLFVRMEAARLAGRQDYARNLATEWLASWPGDHEVQLVLARLEIALGNPQAASQRLQHLIVVDPMLTEAYEALAESYTASGEPARGQIYHACAMVLSGETAPAVGFSAWASKLSLAVKALQSGDAATARAGLQECLTSGPDLPLASCLALRAALASGHTDHAHSLAKTGAERWPGCVYFQLAAGSDQLVSGDAAAGVDALHRAASGDPTGRISRAFLGEGHPYLSLWPGNMSAPLSRPLPADVARVLGDNRLAGAPPGSSAGASAKDYAVRNQPPPSVDDQTSTDGGASSPGAAEPKDEPPQPASDLPRPADWESFQGPDSGDQLSREEHQSQQTVTEVRQSLDDLAARLRAPLGERNAAGRIPAYVVLSSKTRLLQELGESSYQAVDSALRDLITTAQRRPRWTAYLVYVDDPPSLQPFGLIPADPRNPWQIKLQLADLDEVLGRRGQMIGAVLIVGGDRILPFHSLPNPTDDDDASVASDNPYAASDENYLAPEWPVGRLPFDADPVALVRILHGIEQDHRLNLRPQSPLTRIRTWLSSISGWRGSRRARTLGYTASIWRRASMAVYRIIGEPGTMISSPPVQASALPSTALRPTRLSYYNLHGLEDAPEWFGHRDPLRDQDAALEFPVALRPQDVVNGGRAPMIVFSEACYGANSIGKSADTALCMKFLASGTKAFIGSTKISYGSVATPLLAADLLGRLFWDHLNRGTQVGEALRRAKIRYAMEMHRRQGFLDGEDQKTLISFILYGDPLASAGLSRSHPVPRAATRGREQSAAMKVACARGGPDVAENTLEPGSFERIKGIAAQYLPGMSDAVCRIHPQSCSCNGDDHVCVSRQVGLKSPAGPTASQTLIVTFSKAIPDGLRSHPRYARLTIDRSGKVLKLAVSR